MKFLYICIFFFRVTEINRFLLDHEYPNISEASKVIRHVPNYDFEKLSPHMQVIWPIICQKNQLIIESNLWLATPIQNLEYKKYIIVNSFWRSTHSYCKHGNPENERNFKVHPSLDIVNEPVRPLLFTISSHSLYQGKVFL